MVVDFHVHCFPDSLADKATLALQEKAGISRYLNGTVGNIRASMGDSGISHSVVLSIATKPQQTRKITEWSLSIQDGSITAFSSIHPDSADWESEMAEVRDLGLKGIKFHPEYQEFYVDEDRMFPIYSKAFDLGLIVVFHAGADLGYPEPCHCTPDRLARVVDAFPGGRMVAAHFGGFKYWDGVAKHLAGKDIYLDTSFTLGWIERELFDRILDSHGYERLLFASDSPWGNQRAELEMVKGLDLPPLAQSAIFGGNAARLLGL